MMGSSSWPGSGELTKKTWTEGYFRKARQYSMRLALEKTASMSARRVRGDGTCEGRAIIRTGDADEDERDDL